MRILIRKLHMYTGLLNFSALMVFGIAGLTATFQAAPDQRHRESRVEYTAFTIPANVSDRELAAQVYDFLRIPLTQPIPSWAIHRNTQNQLALDFYTLNGIHRVTVLEHENQLRIQDQPNSFWQFVNNLHSVTVNEGPRDLRIRLWSWYNEFAIWSLIGMTISGVYLWLSSRPGFRWAQLSFVAGSGTFVVLYVITR